MDDEEDIGGRKPLWNDVDESSDEELQIPSLTEHEEEDYTSDEGNLDPETGMIKKITEPIGEPSKNPHRT